MSQKYKIYINNKIVYIVDNPSIMATELLSDDHFIIKAFSSQEALTKVLTIITDPENDSNLILYGADVEHILKELEHQFKRIDAAGGVVINEKDELLMIFRKGFWDLPKGKLDDGESLVVAAVREVKEETGLKNVELLSPITFEGLLNKATYHTYRHNEKDILKVSHWYMMRGNSREKLIPQIDEDIEEVQWMDKSEVESIKSKMYLNIQDIIDEVFS